MNFCKKLTKLITTRFFLILCFLFLALNAEAKNQKIENFSKSKKILSIIHKSNPKTFYCDCLFQGKIPNLKSCGYQPYKNVNRANRIEWEHVLPASRFGKKFNTWKKGHVKCKKSNGKSYKGRKCTEKIDKIFRFMQADLYNLQPTIGEVNGMRSNYKMSIIRGEDRIFGKCDFEIKNKMVEPALKIRGNIARTYLYMNETYTNYITLTKDEIKLFQKWDNLDPVDDWECKRAEQIRKIQGNENHILSEKCISKAKTDLGEQYAIWVPGDNIIWVDENENAHVYQCPVKEKCIKPFHKIGEFKGKVKRINNNVIQINKKPLYACKIDPNKNYTKHAYCGKEGWIIGKYNSIQKQKNLDKKNKEIDLKNTYKSKKGSYTGQGNQHFLK